MGADKPNVMFGSPGPICHVGLIATLTLWTAAPARITTTSCRK
jgi:hypothetical protein